MGKSSTFAATLAAGLLFAAAPLGAEGQPAKVKAEISRADCAQLVVRHRPGPDVRYGAGRDVYGRQVAPAGAPGQPSLQSPGAYVLGPETYTIELELDLRQFLGLATIPGLNPNLRPGRITVIDGRVYFNGRPLDDPRRFQVVEACRERLRRKR